MRLPGIPAVALPVDVDKTLPAVTGALDPGRLQDLRKLRVLDLIRRHPTVIEPDPNGAPIIRSGAGALGSTCFWKFAGSTSSGSGQEGCGVASLMLAI